MLTRENLIFTMEVLNLKKGSYQKKRKDLLLMLYHVLW